MTTTTTIARPTSPGLLEQTLARLRFRPARGRPDEAPPAAPCGGLGGGRPPGRARPPAPRLAGRLDAGGRGRAAPGRPAPAVGRGALRPRHALVRSARGAGDRPRLRTCRPAVHRGVGEHRRGGGRRGASPGGQRPHPQAEPRPPLAGHRARAGGRAGATGEPRGPAGPGRGARLAGGADRHRRARVPQPPGRAADHHRQPPALGPGSRSTRRRWRGRPGASGIW